MESLRVISSGFKKLAGARTKLRTRIARFRDKSPEVQQPPIPETKDTVELNGRQVNRERLEKVKAAAAKLKAEDEAAAKLQAEAPVQKPFYDDTFEKTVKKIDNEPKGPELSEGILTGHHLSDDDIEVNNLIRMNQALSRQLELDASLPVTKIPTPVAATREAAPAPHQAGSRADSIHDSGYAPSLKDAKAASEASEEAADAADLLPLLPRSESRMDKPGLHPPASLHEAVPVAVSKPPVVEEEIAKQASASTESLVSMAPPIPQRKRPPLNESELDRTVAEGLQSARSNPETATIRTSSTGTSHDDFYDVDFGHFSHESLIPPPLGSGKPIDPDNVSIASSASDASTGTFLTGRSRFGESTDSLLSQTSGKGRRSVFREDLPQMEPGIRSGFSSRNASVETFATAVDDTKRPLSLAEQKEMMLGDEPTGHPALASQENLHPENAGISPSTKPETLRQSVDNGLLHPEIPSGFRKGHRRQQSSISSAFSIGSTWSDVSARFERLRSFPSGSVRNVVDSHFKKIAGLSRPLNGN